MSRNTSIEEGGQARPFGPVKCLMVEGEDGKYYPWFPEEDRVLENTLTVDKNGVYQASKTGVYGWKSVNVNVPTTDGIAGKDPQTGEEVYVHPDPETGELVKDALPEEIRVITPPTNPYGIYVDGQTITKDGMVVKAYDAHGNEMLTVPIGQITINPTTAVYDPEHDTHDEFNELVTPPDGLIPGDVQIRVRAGLSLTVPRGNEVVHMNCNQSISMCHRRNAAVVIGGKHSPITVDFYVAYPNGGESQHVISNYTNTYTYEDKTVVWGINTLYGEFMPYQENLSPNSEFNKLAWAMIYGDIEEVPAGSRQIITVSWPRNGDGKALTTSFVILVGPRGGGGED